VVLRYTPQHNGATPQSGLTLEPPETTGKSPRSVIRYTPRNNGNPPARSYAVPPDTTGCRRTVNAREFTSVLADPTAPPRVLTLRPPPTGLVPPRWSYAVPPDGKLKLSRLARSSSETPRHRQGGAPRSRTLATDPPGDGTGDSWRASRSPGRARAPPVERRAPADSTDFGLTISIFSSISPDSALAESRERRRDRRNRTTCSQAAPSGPSIPQAAPIVVRRAGSGGGSAGVFWIGCPFFGEPGGSRRAPCPPDRSYADPPAHGTSPPDWSYAVPPAPGEY